MPRELLFSRRAEADLQSIDDYTVQTWGTSQADLYLDQLDACCRALAAQPDLGRFFGRKRAGLRRMEEGSHVIFYRIASRSIFISRVLHKSMVPSPQSFADDPLEGSPVE